MGVRRFRAEDWMGAQILCPHCGGTFKVVDVMGPQLGYNDQAEIDHYWNLLLSDGCWVRMWEDGKGIIEEEFPP